jgi:hypothetical protein
MFFWLGLLLTPGLSWIISVLPTMEEFLQKIGFLAAKIYLMLPTMEEFLRTIGFIAADVPFADHIYKRITQVVSSVRELGLLWIMIYLYLTIVMIVIIFVFFQMICLLTGSIVDERIKTPKARNHELGSKTRSQQARSQVEKSASNSTSEHQREFETYIRKSTVVVDNLKAKLEAYKIAGTKHMHKLLGEMEELKEKHVKDINQLKENHAREIDDLKADHAREKGLLDSLSPKIPALESEKLDLQRAHAE